MCDDVDYTQCNKHNAQIASDRSDLLPRISLVLVFGIVDVVIESLLKSFKLFPHIRPSFIYCLFNHSLD